MKKLSDFSTVVGGRLINGDARFTSASIDTRTLAVGQLFVAIEGPNFDGHQFIRDAEAKFAAAVMVSKVADTKLPQLLVPDTRIALGQMAKAYRQQLTIPVIGITGSCGKTTTKTMIASILSCAGNVLATEGTLNNDFGLPVTVMAIQEEHEYAVLEMGANHLQEIAYLTDIAQPDIAMITNAAAVHLEGFGDVAGVAKGKGEIFQGLTAQGTAILNADDEYFSYWQSITQDKQQVSFGLSDTADVRAENIVVDAQGQIGFDLITPKGEVAVQLSVIGEHNVMNALAAAAASLCAGANLDNVQQGLQNMRAVNKRLVKKVAACGAQIIDDTYNANPLSMEAALVVLAQCEQEAVFVMGDMAELGDNAAFYHQQLAEKAQQYGVKKLYAVGELAKHTVEAFGPGACHFQTQADLIAQLQGDLTKNMCVLVKGSRSMQMEKVVAAISGE